jgi:uncharacterized membrane protein
VWNKTNRLAGKLFKAAGILAMLGAVFPEHAILFILVPVILAGVYPLIYSPEYQREKKDVTWVVASKGINLTNC